MQSIEQAAIEFEGVALEPTVQSPEERGLSPRRAVRSFAVKRRGLPWKMRFSRFRNRKHL